MLFVAIFVYEQVINEKEIEQLKAKIEQTDSIIKQLKTYHRYGIFIGDTTAHYTTNLKINKEDYRYLHIKKIKPGVNKYYFVLKSGVGVDLIVNKY